MIQHMCVYTGLLFIFILSNSPNALGQSHRFYDTVLEEGISSHLENYDFQTIETEAYPVGTRRLAVSSKNENHQIFLYHNIEGQIWDIGIPLDSSLYLMKDLFQKYAAEEKMVSTALWYVNYANKDLLINWISTNQISFEETIGQETSSNATYILDKREQAKEFKLVEVGSLEADKAMYLLFSGANSTPLRIEFPLSIESATRGYASMYASAILSDASDSTLYWKFAHHANPCLNKEVDSLNPQPNSDDKVLSILKEAIMSSKELNASILRESVTKIRLMNWDEEEMKFGQQVTLEAFIAYWNNLNKAQSFCASQFIQTEEGNRFIIKWQEPYRLSQSMLYLEKEEASYQISLVY